VATKGNAPPHTPLAAKSPFEIGHYQAAFLPLLYGVGLALVLTLVVKETGPAARREAPTAEARGQIEGVGTVPRLTAKDGAGEKLADPPLDAAVRDGRGAFELDLDANDRKGPRISAARSRVSAWVIPTNEELMIARHTGRLLALVPARG